MARSTSFLVPFVLLTAGTAAAAMSGTDCIKKCVTSGGTFASFGAAGSAFQIQR